MIPEKSDKNCDDSNFLPLCLQITPHAPRFNFCGLLLVSQGSPRFPDVSSYSSTRVSRTSHVVGYRWLPLLPRAACEIAACQIASRFSVSPGSHVPPISRVFPQCGRCVGTVWKVSTSALLTRFSHCSHRLPTNSFTFRHPFPFFSSTKVTKLIFSTPFSTARRNYGRDQTFYSASSSVPASLSVLATDPVRRPSLTSNLRLPSLNWVTQLGRGVSQVLSLQQQSPGSHVTR